jgi:hypothetical protein
MVAPIRKLGPQPRCAKLGRPERYRSISAGRGEAPRYPTGTGSQLAESRFLCLRVPHGLRVGSEASINVRLHSADNMLTSVPPSGTLRWAIGRKMESARVRSVYST